MSDATRSPDAAAAGDRKAADLLPLVSDELRPLAAARLSHAAAAATMHARERTSRERMGVSGLNAHPSQRVGATSRHPCPVRWFGHQKKSEIGLAARPKAVYKKARYLSVSVRLPSSRVPFPSQRASESDMRPSINRWLKSVGLTFAPPL